MSLYSKNKNFIYKTIDKSLPGSINLDSKLKKGAPRCICFSAVYTLEAAVIMPLLACFFVSILLFFRIMQVELEVQKALDDTGRKMAVYAAVQSVGDLPEAAELTLVKGLFLKEAQEGKAIERYVTGNKLGISLAESKLDGDYIDLKAVYRIRLPVHLFGIGDIRVVQRARCRKWTGWHGTGESEGDDVWVYITETGTVYHREKSCTHLTLSIKSVGSQEVRELRNENGGKYHECILCIKEKGGQNRVYITNQGDRYHYDLNCSGIKRTVSVIRLSEAGSRRACSKCGYGQ